ncbi:MAG: glycosyltransferase [Nodosilinea sp.]
MREFGGAVVLEAMASGLPCIVVNNGGIGEYVTEKTGFRIDPISRDFVVQELKISIEKLVCDQTLRHNMSLQAVQRAKGRKSLVGVLRQKQLLIFIRS